VLDEAERGDDVAVRLVAELGRTVAEYALVAAGRVGLVGSPFRLVFGGGLLQHRHASTSLEAAILATVSASSPGVTAVKADVPPVAGAVSLALEETGVETDERVTRHLREGLAALELAST
jgi:hypothetical protein